MQEGGQEAIPVPFSCFDQHLVCEPMNWGELRVPVKERDSFFPGELENEVTGEGRNRQN